MLFFYRTELYFDVIGMRLKFTRYETKTTILLQLLLLSLLITQQVLDRFMSDSLS